MVYAKRSRSRRHGRAGTTDDTTKSGLAPDPAIAGPQQDTPGRPKTASSRQQTQPEQNSQTGSAKLDAHSRGRHND
jgi:hypothetical protein